jgi:hypothetical protein
VQAQVQQRLEELRSEFEAGQRMLAELDARRAELQQTLLRIGGAVQVLEELLDTSGAAGEQAGNGASPPPADGTADADRTWSAVDAANGQPTTAGLP